MGEPGDTDNQPNANELSPKSLAAFAISPICLLIGAMLLLGLILRVYAFGFPDSFMFDEHHFVENARNYLHHQPDWNDHPPLGKLFIALSIRAFGDNSVGWRVPALVLGLVTILCGGLAAARMFKSKHAGWIAAAFLSVDGFHIAYSRAALLDGYLAAFLAMALFVATFPLNFASALAAGFVLGIAASVKFSGITVLLPLTVAALFAPVTKRKLFACTGLVGVVAAVVYFAQYACGLSLAGKAASPIDVVNDTQRLIDHHAALTDMKNPWVSGWITWGVPTRPALLSYARHWGEVRVLSGMGNIALWWPGVALTVILVGVIIAKGVLFVAASPNEQTTQSNSVSVVAFLRQHGRAELVLLAGCIGFIAPWVVSHRDSYIYHFLPAYTAIIVTLSGYVAWVRKHKPIDALLFIGLVLVVAAFYAPIWSSMATSEAAVNARLFLRGWR